MAKMNFSSEQGYWPGQLRDVLAGGKFSSPFNTASTRLELKLGDLALIITGTGLKASAARKITAGTITGFELRGPDGKIATLSDYTIKPKVSDLQKVMTHLEGTVNQTTYVDLLQTAFFTEGLTIKGHGGFDFLVGSRFADTIDGSGGSNFLEYSLETGPNGVIFNFKTGKVTDSYGNVDTIKNVIEASGSARGDTFISSGNADYHFWMGNDGADTYQGDKNTWETVSYRFEEGTKGVVANLKTGKGTDTRGNAEIYVNIDEVEGSNNKDSLTGSDGDNAFAGNNGADTIDGGKGQDEVHYHWEQSAGGVGGVIVNLSAQSISANVGKGNKTVASGKAIDTFGKTDTLISIEHVKGTNFDDVIYGDKYRNELEGFDGDDILFGGGGDDNLRGSDGHDRLYGESGNDTFKGGIGNDHIDGGSGTDRVNYFLETPASTDTSGQHGVIVNLSTKTIKAVAISGVSARDVLAGKAVDATGGTDTLVSIEDLETTEFQDHVVGSSAGNHFRLGAGNDLARGGSGDDSLYGEAGNDTLYGDAGHDHLEGGDGNDKLYGGDGDDYFIGDKGTDLFDGGNDWDKVSYGEEAGSKGIVVDMATGKITDTFGTIDTVIDIEGIKGSRHADSFSGSSRDDSFEGLAGADTFDGKGGNDNVNYQFEHDFGGSQGVIVNLSSSAITANIGKGTKTVASGKAIDTFGHVDTLKSIEGIEGSRFGDVIYGSSGNNWLDGQAGDDILYGGGGHDNLRGSDGNDTLYGDAGDDTFKGGTGNDLMDGGSGRDRVQYFLETPASGDNSGKHGVIVNLSTTGITADVGQGSKTVAAGKAIDATGGTDTLISIEEAETTEFNDYIVGSSADNWFKSGDGDDVIVGGGGNDVLWGEGGRDTLTGGSGNDRFVFDFIHEMGKTTSSRDVITDFGNGSDLIDFGAIDANSTTAANDGFKFKSAQSKTFDGTKGQLIWFQENPSGSANDKTIIMGDVDGDKVADFQLELTGLVSLNSSHFWL